MGTRLTPQQRWWALQARYPIFKRPPWRLACGGCLPLLIFLIFGLPFLLPLGGPDVIPLENLADENGAFINVNGVQVYFIHENGRDAPVIFLHGFGGSSADWSAVMTDLDEHERYALDLPGFGLSEKRLDLDLSGQALADDVAAFMDTQQIEAAHIVAHDLGGNVALHLAGRHPERVLSLTLVAAAVQTEPTTPVPDQLFEWSFAQHWARVLLRSIMPKANEINLNSAVEREDAITAEVIQNSERAFHTQDWDLALLALARDNSRSALGLSANLAGCSGADRLGRGG